MCLNICIYINFTLKFYDSIRGSAYCPVIAGEYNSTTTKQNTFEITIKKTFCVCPRTMIAVCCGTHVQKNKAELPDETFWNNLLKYFFCNKCHRLGTAKRQSASLYKLREVGSNLSLTSLPKQAFGPTLQRFVQSFPNTFSLQSFLAKMNIFKSSHKSSRAPRLRSFYELERSKYMR